VSKSNSSLAEACPQKISEGIVPPATAAYREGQQSMLNGEHLPLVSAVIPTRNRSEMVCRAVRCALSQTYLNLEVVVVIDGPDPATMEALEALSEPRLRIVALSENVGGSEARNHGVRNARGEWIAFLDDDDEWLPEKIEKQLAAAATMSEPLSFVACQFVDRDRYGQRVFPMVNQNSDAPFSEYLLCRPGLFRGSGYVQTSTWLVSRKLADKCAFTPRLKRNQDLDWMLRAMSIPDAHFRLVGEPLSIFNSVQHEGRVSKSADWEFHYRWAIENRQYFTRRALAYFLSTTCVEDAVRQGMRLPAGPKLMRAILRYGDASFTSFLYFFYYFFVSENFRQRSRSAVASIRNTKTRTSLCG
jgi:glycosyltransferase involved in cell wall biosynthesis